MAKIKIKLEREHLIQAIVIMTALVFIFSTVSMWFRSSNNGGGSTITDGSETETLNITTAKATINLTLERYTAKIIVNQLNDKNAQLIDKLNSEGKVMYVNNRSDGITILLSSPDDTWSVAKTILANDRNVSILLEGIAYSDKEYTFQPLNNVGETLKSKIPRSKVSLNYPYEVGSVLSYDALAQFIDGQLTTAKLYPRNIKAQLKVPVIVNGLDSKYYVQMIVRWSDRIKAEEDEYILNDTLKEMGATNISFNYITDHSVYTSRILNKTEIEKLKELLPGLKLRDANRLIFYSNYSYTEEEVYDAVNISTGGTVDVTFAISYMEISFDLEDGENVSERLIENYTVTPMYYKVWRRGDVSTGEIRVPYEGKQYSVPDIHMKAWIPENKAEVNRIVTLLFDAYLEGDRVSSLTQNILDQTPYISTQVQPH